MFKVGNRVWWNDPDKTAGNSGYGTITASNGMSEAIDEGDDVVITVSKDDGGEVECFAHELERAPDIPFSPSELTTLLEASIRALYGESDILDSVCKKRNISISGLIDLRVKFTEYMMNNDD
jgi:hypothetical protein